MFDFLRALNAPAAGAGPVSVDDLENLIGRLARAGLDWVADMRARQAQRFAPFLDPEIRSQLISPWGVRQMQLADSLAAATTSSNGDSSSQTLSNPGSQGTTRSPAAEALKITPLSASSTQTDDTKSLPDPQKPLTVKEAARYASLSKQMIYKLIRSGELKYLKAGRVKGVRRADLDRYLEALPTKATPGAWERLAGSRPRP